MQFAEVTTKDSFEDATIETESNLHEKGIHPARTLDRDCNNRHSGRDAAAFAAAGEGVWNSLNVPEQSASIRRIPV